MRLPHRHRGWPRNDTAPSPAYDEARWVYVCDRCGYRKPVPPEDVSHDGLGVSIRIPRGWK